MIVLDDDTLANSDLNVLYKHIINENNKHLIKKQIKLSQIISMNSIVTSKIWYRCRNQLIIWFITLQMLISPTNTTLSALKSLAEC